MNKFQHLTLSFFLTIITFTVYPHANFDLAVLRVYEKNPSLKQSTRKPTVKNSTASTEKLYKTVHITTLITTGIRLSRSYYVHQKNTNAQWLQPAFLCRWGNNIYFFSDVSRIMLQTIVAKFIIKGIFWYVQL